MPSFNRSAVFVYRLGKQCCKEVEARAFIQRNTVLYLQWVMFYTLWHWAPDSWPWNDSNSFHLSITLGFPVSKCPSVTIVSMKVACCMYLDSGEQKVLSHKKIDSECTFVNLLWVTMNEQSSHCLCCNGRWLHFVCLRRFLYRCLAQMRIHYQPWHMVCIVYWDTCTFEL